MSKTIADYTAAVSIDAANDFLLIEPSGNTVYKRISRNVLLGLSSAPLGTTDSQSPTNKTFDNTNTVTLKDTLFTLQDDGDTSKQARFQLSGITTATTRTYTLPNASDTLAGIATTQTLTNKTITSPTITGGTIDNTTITVDSISGHTTSTLVTVANMQISNGVINTANAVTSTSIAAGAVQPQALVSGTGSGWSWQSWTPTWTNMSTGASTVSAKYIQVGKTVFYRIGVTFAGGNTPSGDVSFTLPVTSVTFPGSSTTQTMGQVNFYNTGVKVYDGTVVWGTTTTAFLRVLQNADASGAYLNETTISAAIPFAWGNTHQLFCQGLYEAA